MFILTLQVSLLPVIKTSLSYKDAICLQTAIPGITVHEYSTKAVTQAIQQVTDQCYYTGDSSQDVVLLIFCLFL